MLTNEEFERLLSENKVFEDQSSICIPGKGGKIKRELKSRFTDNKFILNIERGRIDLSKVKYQTRHIEKNCVLLRIDTKGPRHQNPDGEFIECPHIHIYKDGWGDKWAKPLDPNIFKNTTNLDELLRDLLLFFNVNNIPNISLEDVQEELIL